jgi:hypothetical protein
MKMFRKLLCKIGRHEWDNPTDYNGPTYAQKCKHCGLQELVIQVIMEGDFGTEVGGDYDLWDVNKREPVERKK